MSLVHSKVLLYTSRCKDRTLWSFEHSLWHLDQFADLFFVLDAVEDFLLRRLAEVFLRQLGQLPSVDIRQLHAELAEQFFEVHQHEADGAPAVDVRPPEGNEFGRLINQLALAEQQLVQRVLVHQLVVGPGLGLKRQLLRVWAGRRACRPAGWLSI